jgi:acetolactate synthase-1/2/3 large subunit
MPAKPLISESTTVPAAIVQILEEAGIDFVFGMPGGRTGMLFQALFDHPRIRAVLVRHESLASVMAEVYGRLTHRPGVAIGQGAFMLANGGLGILESHLGSSPMLVLSDVTDGAPYSHHGPYQVGTGEYGAWDAKRAFEGMTKATFTPTEAVQAVQVTQLAIKHAVSGEPGPVGVFYYTRALRGSVDPDDRPALYKTIHYIDRPVYRADPERAERVAKLLRDANSPVIVAGNGVRCANAFDELRLFAERLDVPVATTAAGKGVIAETHPLALGTIGNFGLAAAHRVIADADLVLAVGTKLGATDTANESNRLIDPARQVLVQIDIEPRNASWTFPADEVLIGDAAAVLTQLRDLVDQQTHGAVERVAEAHQRWGSFEVPESTADDSPLLPQRIIHDLQEALPDDAYVTCDAGENRIFMSHHFKTRMAGHFLQPASVGAMGYALPAAMVVKLLHPKSPVVAVCGDGGLGISTPALFTAVEEQIPIVAVIFNNSALGWVLHGQASRPIASKFGDFDYAAVARAVGWEGTRVELADDLLPALRDALKSRRPVLIDVVTSLSESFQKVTSDLLEVPATAGRR